MAERAADDAHEIKRNLIRIQKEEGRWVPCVEHDFKLGEGFYTCARCLEITYVKQPSG